MNLEQLRALGAFKDRSIVPRSVTLKHKPLLPESEWDDPNVPKYADEPFEDSIDCFIRKRSSADNLELARAEEHLVPHLTVLRGVVDKNGKPIFPDLDTVVGLEEWVLLPLFSAVAEVNTIGPKASPPKTSSGANSRSDSGAARSRSGRKWSRPKSAKRGSSTPASAAPSTPSVD